MVTVDVFLVSLFVGAERVCAGEILDTHVCSEYISEAEWLRQQENVNE